MLNRLYTNTFAHKDVSHILSEDFVFNEIVINCPVICEIEENIIGFDRVRAALLIAEYQINPVMQILKTHTHKSKSKTYT